MVLAVNFSLSAQRFVSASFSVTLTGLTDGEAQIGDHASIGYTTDATSETVKWSDSSDPAAAATYGTGANPTDFTAGDGGLLWLHVTDNGETVSRSAPIRYARGTFSVGNQSPWTVDDTAVSLDASASGTGLTFSNYILFGIPGLSINSSTGQITGTISYADFLALSSGVAGVTCEDQYGREYYSGDFTWSAVLRTQAAGGTNLDLSFTEDAAISSTDLIANWTTNGNTLTFVSVSPALPAGLSINSSGTMTGTPTTATADATYTLTMQDEYGRETSDTFTLEVVSDTFAVTDEGDGTIAVTWNGTLDSITVGGGGVFDGTYTVFHDGTALIDTHLDGVAGRALEILPTTGTPTEGQTLTAGAYLILHAQVAEPTVTIQWQRDGVNISGATGSTYALQAADVGANVRPTFTIASPGLTSVTEIGSALGPVASGSAAINSVTGVPGGGVLIDYTGTLTVTPAAGGGLILEVS